MSEDTQHSDNFASGLIKPCIVVDKREKKPLLFTRFPAVPGLLPTGDYSVAGAEHLFAVERKALRDLLACSTGRERERFERAMQRLRAYPFRRLLIVGAETAITQRKAAWHLLLEWEIRFAVPVVFAPTPERAAFLIERWSFWFCRVAIATAREIASPSKETLTTDHAAR